MFAIMLVVGIAVPLWRGREMRRAKGSAGSGEIDFGEQTKATQAAMDDLNTRVTKQMGDVNKRLYDLETRVFKESEAAGEGQE